MDDEEERKAHEAAVAAAWDKAELWRGVQWRVGSMGIDQIDKDGPNGYWIEAGQLASRSPYWPSHMAEKYWVNLEEFITAYVIACVVHGVKMPEIAEEIARAKKKRAEGDAYAKGLRSKR